MRKAVRLLEIVHMFFQKVYQPITRHCSITLSKRHHKYDVFMGYRNGTSVLIGPYTLNVY